MNKHVCLIKNHIVKLLIANKSALDMFAILPIFKLKYTPCEIWHEIYKDAQDNQVLVHKLKLLFDDLQTAKYIDINELIDNSLRDSGSIPIQRTLNSSRSYKVLGKCNNILGFKSYDVAKELTRQCIDNLKLINNQLLIKHIMAESKKSYDVGIMHLVDHFERLSKLVATEIINNPEDPWRVIIKFLKICNHLYNMHNYHSLFAIISGLSTKLIYENIMNNNIAKFETFYELLSFNKNYNLYRNDINKHSDAIPYIGILMGDIRHLLECKLFIPMNDDEDININLLNSIINIVKTVSPMKYTIISDTNYDIYYYFITTTLITNTEYIDIKLGSILNQSVKNKLINRLFRSNSTRNSL